MTMTPSRTLGPEPTIDHGAGKGSVTTQPTLAPAAFATKYGAANLGLITLALAPVHFETIDPCLDGNGRVGRLLITLLITECGVLHKPVL